MHHNIAPNDPVRHNGLAEKPLVALLGFEDDSPRIDAYLKALPSGCGVYIPNKSVDNFG